MPVFWEMEETKVNLLAYSISAQFIESAFIMK
jgi:hypothetical protein